MRAPTAPSFTKFYSAYLTRTAESLQNPGAPAGRALAQNEFPSKQWARQRRAHSLYSIQPYLTRTAESLQNPGAPAGRVLAQNEFRTQRRPLNVAFVLRRTVRNFEEAPALPGLPGSRLRERRSHEIERQGPAPGPSVPVYESDVLSNSLKSFGLPLPRLAFMHWPTKKPMTFWLPSRYCCA